MPICGGRLIVPRDRVGTQDGDLDGDSCLPLPLGDKGTPLGMERADAKAHEKPQKEKEGACEPCKCVVHDRV